MAEEKSCQYDNETVAYKRKVLIGKGNVSHKDDRESGKKNLNVIVNLR